MEAKISSDEIAYFNQGNVKLTTVSSVLISSSPYLNHPTLPQMLAQEMLRRNGPDVSPTAYIPEVAQIFHQLENVGRIIELFEMEKARLPKFREWLEKRSLANFRLDDVAHCAPGTLGAAIHHFMATSGYELEFMFKEIPVVNDFTFYLRQTAVTHDIEHIVTGFGPNHGGEIALIEANLQSKARYFCAELASFFNRIPTYLKAKTMLKDVLFYPDAHVLVQEAQVQGQRQGLNWKYPLMLADWRAMIDMPLTEVQAELGITPVPEPGLWADTTDLAIDPREDLAQAAE